jgi:hypothetical protein
LPQLQTLKANIKRRDNFNEYKETEEYKNRQAEKGHAKTRSELKKLNKSFKTYPSDIKSSQVYNYKLKQYLDRGINDLSYDDYITKYDTVTTAFNAALIEKDGAKKQKLIQDNLPLFREILNRSGEVQQGGRFGDNYLTMLKAANKKITTAYSKKAPQKEIKKVGGAEYGSNIHTIHEYNIDRTENDVIPAPTATINDLHNAVLNPK